MFKRERKTRRNVQDQIRTAIRRATQLVEDADYEHLARKPEDGGWSALECMEHLNATARLYLPELSEAIEAAREAGHTAPPGSPERTVLGRLAAWGMEPPPRFRTRTFTEMEPGEELDPAAVLEEFEALHEELIVRINEAADLDRKKVKLQSVLDSRLKLSLGDWFHFLAAHARRHLWQAERALERRGR